MRAAEPEKPVILLTGAPQKPGKPFDLYFQVSGCSANERNHGKNVNHPINVNVKKELRTPFFLIRVSHVSKQKLDKCQGDFHVN